MMAYVRLAVAGLIFASLVGFYIQTKRAAYYRATSEEYSRTIVQLEQAVRLTESLRKANEKLKQDRNDLLEELRHVEGRNIPLSDGVISIIERLRAESFKF